MKGVNDWGFFFFNGRLAKDFVAGKRVSPGGDFSGVNIGDRGGVMIPTTKDISEDLTFLSERSNIQIIDKSTDNFSFTCGRLDVLIATNHLQSVCIEE